WRPRKAERRVQRFAGVGHDPAERAIGAADDQLARSVDQRQKRATLLRACRLQDENKRADEYRQKGENAPNFHCRSGPCRYPNQAHAQAVAYFCFFRHILKVTRISKICRPRKTGGMPCQSRRDSSLEFVKQMNQKHPVHLLPYKTPFCRVDLLALGSGGYLELVGH